MPLGIISDEELEQELENHQRTVIHKDIPGKGRPAGSKNVPDVIKKIISEEAIEGANKEQLAKEFGISAQMVNAYKNDATSLATYNQPNGELVKHNNQVRTRIIKRAEGKMMFALKCLTPKKLEDGSLKELSSVARDMSVVIQNMEPKKEEDKAPMAQFIIHVPPQRTEKDYEVIQVEN